MIEEEPINKKEERYKNLHFRMYEKKYPEKEELVYVKVVEKNDFCAIVTLYEYDNIRGIILRKEYALKRFNSLKQFSIGKDEILTVLKVDANKGFIDLVKKGVSPDKIKKYKKKFEKSKKVENIVKLLSVQTNKTMEYLYKNIIWPLYKQYEHAYDALQLFLNGDNTIFDNIKITDNIKKELIQILNNRLRTQPVKKEVFLN